MVRDITPLAQESSQPLAVLACHNPPPFLSEVVQNLPEFVAVDNESSDFSAYASVRRVEANMFGPSYEMGALLHGFTRYIRPRYLAGQDSLIIHDARMLNTPATLYDDPAPNAVFAFCPIRPCSMNISSQNYEWLHAHFPDISEAELNNSTGIQCNAFSATRDQIQALIDSVFLSEEHLPRDKAASETWERVLGVAFARLGIPVEFLADGPHAGSPIFTKHFLGRP